jgi:hypothetical protein
VPSWTGTRPPGSPGEGSRRGAVPVVRLVLNSSKQVHPERLERPGCAAARVVGHQRPGPGSGRKGHAAPGRRHPLGRSAGQGGFGRERAHAEQGHLLGPLTAAVYRLADGTRTLTDLTTTVTRTHPTAGAATIRLALAELATAGLQCSRRGRTGIARVTNVSAEYT